MTRYLSIYTGPVRTTGPSEAEQRLVEEGTREGTLLAGEGCLPLEHGAFVRRSGDEYTVTDGPFAESKEVVGGFAMLELPSKDAAVDAAKRFLAAVGTDGQCEVRELYPVPALAESPNRSGAIRYLTLYRTVERDTPPTHEEMDRMGVFMQEMIAAGKLLSTEGCLPTSHGVRVRREHGESTVVDGPFTESKEVVGGFAILAADSKDEVVQLAKRFLAVAGDGESEIRELFHQEAFAAE